MKKILMSVLVLAMAKCASAQDQTFKPFKVDLAIGYAIPGGTGSKGGVLVAVEPKYALDDNFTLGFRLETAIVARVSQTNSTGGFENADVKAAASYLATGDYYFSTNAVRSFVGVGAGLFSVVSAAADSVGNKAVGTGNKFGGMLRGGIEKGHFRVGIEYNIVGSTVLPAFNTNGNFTTVKSKNSYIGIKIGFFFGGGRFESLKD